MTSSERYERIAAIVVTSTELSVRQMVDIVGATPDDVREIGSVRSNTRIPIPAKENSLELSERSGSKTLMDLIDSLLVRVAALRENLMELKAQGCTVKLDLVQWISAEDVNPSFVLDNQMINLLADIGAFVDVDQYVED